MERSLKLLESPARLGGQVVHGFGRGSSQLGFPTANLEIRWDATGEERTKLDPLARDVLDFAEKTPCGIYAAWGRVCDGPDQGVYKVAMSVGWNPHFEGEDAVKNKTIEAWILHDYDDTFYGAHMRLVVLGHVRDEAKFNSLEQLIDEIGKDGKFCESELSQYREYIEDPFFSSS